jgi:sRNA-binding protein
MAVQRNGNKPMSKADPAPLPHAIQEQAFRSSVRGVADVMKRNWPAAFCKPVRPLHYTAQEVVHAALRTTYSANAIDAAWRNWVSSLDYLRAVADGRPEIDLDGKPTGSVPDIRERGAAQVELQRALQRRQGRWRE